MKPFTAGNKKKFRSDVTSLLHDFLAHSTNLSSLNINCLALGEGLKQQLKIRRQVYLQITTEFNFLWKVLLLF